MIFELWLINLGVACALQAPPGRKGLKALRTTSPRTPHAAAAVRKAAARLAFTGLVATAASFAPAAAAKGGGGGAGASSYSSTSYSSSSYDRSYWESDLYYDSKVAVPPLFVCGFLCLSIGIDILVDPDSTERSRRLGSGRRRGPRRHGVGPDLRGERNDVRDRSRRTRHAGGALGRRPLRVDRDVRLRDGPAAT